MIRRSLAILASLHLSYSGVAGADNKDVIRQELQRQRHCLEARMNCDELKKKLIESIKEVPKSDKKILEEIKYALRQFEEDAKKQGRYFNSQDYSDALEAAAKAISSPTDKRGMEVPKNNMSLLRTLRPKQTVPKSSNEMKDMKLEDKRPASGSSNIKDAGT